MFSTLMYGWIQSMSFSLNIVWNVGTSISQTGSGPRSDSCSCWSYQGDMRRGGGCTTQQSRSIMQRLELIMLPLLRRKAFVPREVRKLLLFGFMLVIGMLFQHAGCKMQGTTKLFYPFESTYWHAYRWSDDGTCCLRAEGTISSSQTVASPSVARSECSSLYLSDQIHAHVVRSSLASLM